MRVERAHFKVPVIDGKNVLKRLERYGRVCYKSEDKFSMEDGGYGLLKTIIAKNHASVLEHEKLSILFIIDRGVSHELVRHRMASYSQESTRYCNYSKEKFGREITVIKPVFFKEDQLTIWEQTMGHIEKSYFSLLDAGVKPEEARSILPNSLKTEIVVTMNYRSLRNFFQLRCQPAAHPQIKEVAIPLLLHLQKELPPLFMDIAYDTNFSENNYAHIVTTDEFFQEVK